MLCLKLPWENRVEIKNEKQIRENANTTKMKKMTVASDSGKTAKSWEGVNLIWNLIIQFFNRISLKSIND